MGEKQTWRIVDSSGGVHDVSVTSNNGGIPWSASVPEVTRRSYVSAPDAVVLVAHAMGWGIAEVLAPGERSREELAAAVRAYLAAQDSLDANAANIGAFEDRIVARKALDVLVGDAT